MTCGNIARLEAVVKNVNSNQGSMTWQKRRGNIIKIIDKSREKYSGSTNKKLVIQNVCKEDEGEYYAILKRNMNGYDYTRSENTIQLNVLEGTCTRTFLAKRIKLLRKRNPDSNL